MAKLKTRKSIAKRFKITKSGKVLRRTAGQDRNLRKRTAKKRRSLKNLITLRGPEAKIIKRALKG